MIYECSLKASVFVPGRSRQPSLMFIGKARNLPYSRARKRLERLARDKHFSLLRAFSNYGRKKFHNIWSSL